MITYPLFHYVSPWLSLPGLPILLGILGMLLFRWCRITASMLIFVSIIILWLASAPIVAYNLIELLQNQYPVLSMDAIQHPTPHGVIVVLGGGGETTLERGNQYSVSEVTLNRLRYAAYLHQKTRLPIMVSGGVVYGATQSEADVMLNALRDDFHIETAIKEDKSKNTADEAREIALLLQKNHFDKIYLVTNAWHMPRSMYVFQREGLPVVAAPMGYYLYDHHYSLISYFPDMHALYATSVALHEWIGLVWYRFSGG